MWRSCFMAFLLMVSVSCVYAGDSYLTRLAQRTEAWEGELAGMAESASRAAEGVIAGGTLYAFGPQPGFASEAGGRAGGLISIRIYNPAPGVTLTSKDTVLAAAAGFEDEQALVALSELIARAGEVGAQVVVFTATEFAHSQNPGVTVLPSRPFAVTEGLSLESMSNVIGMWAWTGRFISACVDRGVMPCIYQSHGLPGGPERTKHLQQHDSARFHVRTRVRSDDAHAIAGRYLQIIQKSLRRTAVTNAQAFKEAADLLRQVDEQGGRVAVYTRGHLYPHEFNQPQQPKGFVHSSQITDDMTIGGAIVLYYQAFPWEVVRPIVEADRPCIVICSQPALAAFTESAKHVYLDPSWTIYDGAVELANYDVRLLPASGVMDTAVYWQLVEETLRDD